MEMIDVLIEYSNMDSIYELSKTNKSYEKIFNQKENLNRLYQMHLSKYYDNDITDLKSLYKKYKLLQDKLYIFSKMNFTAKNFKFFQDENDDWIDITYQEFLDKQWNHLFKIDDTKYINVIKYILEHDTDFLIADQQNASIYYRNGYIFNGNGKLCLSTCRD
jgi:hypothetical protein